MSIIFSGVSKDDPLFAATKEDCIDFWESLRVDLESGNVDCDQIDFFLFTCLMGGRIIETLNDDQLTSVSSCLALFYFLTQVC